MSQQKQKHARLVRAVTTALLATISMAIPCLAREATQSKCQVYVESAKYYTTLGDFYSAQRVIDDLERSHCSSIQRYRKYIQVLTKQIAEELSPNGRSVMRIAPYLGIVGYGASASKTGGRLGGVYATWSDRFRLLEADGEILKIQFADTFELTQYMGSAYYSFALSNRLRIRMGGMIISNNAVSLNVGYLGSFGAGYVSDDWEAGAEGYFSLYPDSSQGGLAFVQLTPYFSRRIHLATITTRLVSVFPLSSDNPSLIQAIGDKQVLLSGELDLRLDYSPFYLVASVFGGDRLFSVQNGGFVLFNSFENFRYGVSTSLTADLSQSLSVTVVGRLQWIDNAATAASYTLMAGTAMLQFTI